jgi:hypothetical protein
MRSADANRAALTLERRILDNVPIIDHQEHGERIAAHRVVTLGAARRVSRTPEVPRRSAVIEDHLLIQLT